MDSFWLGVLVGMFGPPLVTSVLYISAALVIGYLDR